jgi:hypothetical protein
VTERCSSLDQVYLCTSLYPKYEFIIINVITLRNFLTFSQIHWGWLAHLCPVCLQNWIVPSRFGVLRQLMALLRVNTLADNSIRLEYEATSIDNRIPTFRRNVISSYSRDEMYKKGPKGPRRNSSAFSHLKMTTLRCVETGGSDYPAMQRRIPEERNRCKNVKSRKETYYTLFIY